MHLTKMHSYFADFKLFSPRILHNPVRALTTAIVGPLIYAYRSGFYRSTFKRAAVTKQGDPLPWYSYPLIDFLKTRDFEEKKILEFGAGQSTRWWAQRASSVVALEGDSHWLNSLKAQILSNVSLHLVSMSSAKQNVEEVAKVLTNFPDASFDVIVIDGLYRREMVPFAIRLLAHDGFIIFDNSEGYGAFEEFKDRNLQRIDFFGMAPGVVLPHCSSVYFNLSSFVFNPKFPIPGTPNAQ